LKKVSTHIVETKIKTNFDYLFYDFETYVNKTGQLEPYAMAYNLVSKDNNKSGVIIKSNIKDNIEKRIAEFFLEYLDNQKICLVGFNNGAFDDYILIDILSTYFKKLDKVLLDSRSRILSATYNGLFTKDLYRFLMTSLQKATQNFKCNISKKFLDHRQIQEHVDDDTFTRYLDDNRDNIIEYSLCDVLSLTELYFKVSEAFTNIDKNMSIDSCLTLSHMSMKAFKAHLISLRNTPKSMALPIVTTFEHDEIMRRAMVGGRCQIFNATEEKTHHVQSIDVVSLYPFVMMNKEFPYLPETYVGHKTWKTSPDEEWFIETNIFVEDKFGIYEVEILAQPNDKIVPKHNDDNHTWDWNYEQRFECWVDSITLSCLQRHGGKFKVISGYFFKLPKAKIFTSFLTPLMKEKMRQDEYQITNNKAFNPALRECIKLSMNSLSGKMGQLPITIEKTISDTQRGCDKFLNMYQKTAEVTLVRNKVWLLKAKIEKPKIKSPTILAILIYAYAREYMYENFISKVQHKYGMDTDSLFIRVSEIGNLDKNLIGSNFGQVKCEFKLDDCYGIYVGKKMYANYRIRDDGTEEIIKYKFKGLSPNDKQISDNRIDEVKIMIENNNLTALRKVWKELHNIDKLQILRDILKQDVVYVLCNHIKKRFNTKDVDNNFTINDTYVVKKFGKNVEQNYEIEEYI
jgi:hypothetical protein